MPVVQTYSPVDSLSSEVSRSNTITGMQSLFAPHYSQSYTHPMQPDQFYEGWGKLDEQGMLMKKFFIEECISIFD